MAMVQSWGLAKASAARVWGPRDRESAALAARTAGEFDGGWSLMGAGRSYADSALPALGAASMNLARMDHVIGFDRQSGILEAEAGATLGAIQELALRSGWGLPVLPGTAQATLGGALANDVHGKNHARAGSFSRCVRSARLFRSDRGVFELNRSQPELWAATVGGLGATGAILSLSIQLERWEGEWIEQRQRRFEGIDEFLSLSGSPWPYEVAWVDAFASRPRGVFFMGRPMPRWGAPKTRALAWPLPAAPLISAPAVRAFNWAYWVAHRDGASAAAHWRSFFCPLDNIQGWNKWYGPRGFSQYQAVVPTGEANAALGEMFKACRRSGMGSFLAVLKRFGEAPSEGVLSFARPGVTFAMDFPNQKSAPELMSRLIAIALEAGGAVYPAKTALSPSEFRRSFPQWEQWRRHWDEQGPTRSGWIERAMG